MNHFYLSIDDNNILRIMNTFEEQPNMINLLSEEYEQSLLFNKFDSETRTFSDPQPIPQTEPEKIDLESAVIELQ